jgi:hypothetical protein
MGSRRLTGSMQRFDAQNARLPQEHSRAGAAIVSVEPRQRLENLPLRQRPPRGVDQLHFADDWL